MFIDAKCAKICPFNLTIKVQTFILMMFAKEFIVFNFCLIFVAINKLILVLQYLRYLVISKLGCFYTNGAFVLIRNNILRILFIIWINCIIYIFIWKIFLFLFNAIDCDIKWITCTFQTNQVLAVENEWNIGAIKFLFTFIANLIEWSFFSQFLWWGLWYSFFRFLTDHFKIYLL